MQKDAKHSTAEFTLLNPALKFQAVYKNMLIFYKWCALLNKYFLKNTNALLQSKGLEAFLRRYRRSALFRPPTLA